MFLQKYTVCVSVYVFTEIYCVHVCVFNRSFITILNEIFVFSFEI